ncbi:hypothetical protein ANO14919_140340 [Xylariales sp. No.14919]|nr:hypothetical protein ANO14919_140340 [Xylariales sp. No.14919]
MDLARSIHSDYLQELEYQHTSLVDIHDSLRVSTNGLFNIVVAFQVKPEGNITRKSSSLSIRPVAEDDPTEYDLTLNVSLSKNAMEYALWYYEHSFSQRQISDLATSFEAALFWAVGPSNTSIRSMELLGESHMQWPRERNQAAPKACKECIHDAIAPFLSSTPFAPAVCAWDGSFTYRDLDHLSFMLSKVLTLAGVVPETYVAIHLEKSRWAPVALLAILRAGGAFTLLDAHLPLSHEQGVCDDLGCQVIISSISPYSDILSARHLIAIGDAEELTWAMISTATTKPAPSQPKHAAYAVFTSGSTGHPKGIIIEHLLFCTSARSQHSLLSINNETKVLQFSSYSWDTTPAVVCLLDPGQVPSLKTVILIGETPSHNDVKTWHSEVSLRETYGLAECTVLATVNQDISSNPRNIGHESGCVCWISQAENHHELMPIGAIGELFIEGPILGRGYVNDPVRTSTVFVENPSWATKLGLQRDVRLYKTGDLAYYTYNGSICYVRRKDDQVKLQEQRIKPGEVEYHILISFDSAEQVIVDVVALDSEAARPFLVAFVKPNSLNETWHASSDSDILAPPSREFVARVALSQAHLKDHLPKRMLPTVFLPLAWVPLTSTCKANRHILKRRAAQLSRAEIQAYIRAEAVGKLSPSTEGERKFRQIWARVLGIAPESIGVNESFFHLGGNSMPAMRLISHCRGMNINISMQTVLQYRTITELSSYVDESRDQGVDTTEITDIPFPLSPMQQTIILSYFQDGAQEGLNIEHSPLLATDHVQVSHEGLNNNAYLMLVCHQLVADLASCRIIVADMEALLRQGGFSPLPSPVPISFQAV